MSAVYSFRKLRIISPAPTSSTIVSASSTTTIVELNHRARRPPLVPRPPSFRTSLTFVFDTCSAGARPKRMPVSTQMPARNPKTT